MTHPASPAASGPARPAWDRDRHLRALGEKIHDLIVVGAGATGCSVARDAALRGLDVCLIDRGDVAAGTSSRSTRFIHGGLRYLKTWEFGFVREGLQERSIFLHVAPHLVRPIPFLFPAYRDRGYPRWMLRLGIGVYGLLAGSRRLSRSRGLSVPETLGREPGLKLDGLTGSVLYTDTLTDDARLVVETAVSAVEAGATVAQHVEVERIIPSDSGPAVLLLKDRLTGASLGARAAVVIHATGVWPGADLIAAAGSPASPARTTDLRPTRGSHLVVSRETLPVSHVVVMPSRRDRRILFAVPSGEFTYLGTTEVVHNGSPDEVRAEPAEIEYIREVTGEIFDGGPLPRDKILATWAGLRPLIDRPGQPTAALSRDFRIVRCAPGVVTVTGGKLTSCRRMAELTVDLAASILWRRFGRRADACITRWKLFPGSEGAAPGPADAPAGLDGDVARHLTATYGSRAEKILKAIARDPASGLPLGRGCAATPAEVIHAVDHEGAVRLADLLFRRLHPLFLEARLATPEGRSLVEKASRIMGERLGWDERRRLEEIDHAFSEWKRDFSVPEAF